MKLRLPKRLRIVYLAFLIPIILAFISGYYFPIFARWLIAQTFNYKASGEANWLWQLTIQFFYWWYTFLAIGIAGIWAVVAAFAKAQQGKKIKRLWYPMVSFIVPAYNEEKNVSRCIRSLFKCAEKYPSTCEIIVVEDGSRDYTYEIAWAAIELNRRKNPKVRGKVIRHSANQGKIEAIKTGVDAALGNLIAIVDADSYWMPETLVKLVDYMHLNGKKAVTGYVHPTDGDHEVNPYMVLQQLEYSQGLGIVRCAQSLGNNVLVISGAIGIYNANVLREILFEKSLRSVTEDLEITLEMHKRKADIGYVSIATSATIVPVSFNALWNQRLRWFTGWLHNTLNIHKDLLVKKSWLTLLLWYCYIFEYIGAFIDLSAMLAFPFLFWFAPDQIFFVLNLLIFLPYGLFIGVINQAIALKYAYHKHNYKALLFYTPFYPILRLINILARLTSTFKYFLGDRGNWHSKIDVKTKHF
ncbi:glycosyltransferase family 2 protein [Candidatus Bathyarchaeota archaeon]|nr:glycosyltransferase family 2 protein [Candidatus Bathyarchaeota archaeon]